MRILIINILIGCLWIAATAFIVSECSHKSEDKPIKTEVHNHYYYDSTEHHITINNHMHPVASLPEPIPQKVDSAEVARLYYAENIYSQESADSNVHISITDTIARNMIKGRKLTYKLIRPVKIEQTVTNSFESKKKLMLFAGLTGGVSPKGLATIGPEIFLIDKSDHAYKLNYNFIDKSINAGIHWKISLKK
jgi:hypothetical protein